MRFLLVDEFAELIAQLCELLERDGQVELGNAVGSLTIVVIA